MEAMTISQVSQNFGVSTRMLRYYEQERLIESFRREDYAYRMYNDEAILKLRQILILRRLRIPVRQIKLILQKPDAVTVIEVFRQNISALDNEITALSTIRSLLGRFREELQKSADIQLQCLLAQDGAMMAAIKSLSLTSIYFKGDKTMDKLKIADETLSKLRDVRIVYLPPATVAAAHYIGDDPEEHANRRIEAFVQSTGLVKIKPDVRHFGFNHPNPVAETGHHGYEIWVTIPEGLEVPPSLEKKQFSGGLYAAHAIAFGNFNEWEWLYNWVIKSDRYEPAGDMRDSEHMFGCLEEHLNYVSHAGRYNPEPPDVQLDLLIPVKDRLT